MSPTAESGERVLLAAGTQTYQHGADFADPLANLDRVPDALRWIVETLANLGYQSERTGAQKYLLNPSLQRLKEAVRATAESAPVVVLYYTGHGLKPERSPYYLITAGARPGRLLGDTALEARQLLDLVLRRDAHDDVAPDDEQPQVLIILDCCFSGAGGIEALKESLQAMGNPKVWVLASASSVEYAREGRFAAALRQALLDPETGSSQRLLGLDWIAERINAALGNAWQRARYFPPGGESTGLPPFFPNPKYIHSVAGLTVAEQQHWVTRLRGAPTNSTTAGFYVTGRTGRIRLVEDLAGWMRDPHRDGLAVVTGSPGCGKSAMLALPVFLTDGQRRDTLVAGADRGSLVARAADLFAGLPVLGVHARGMNPYQATVAIAQYLGRSAHSPEELLEDLEDHPETSSRIVVIDAVDEARDPRRLLTDLLVPLAHRRGLRLVVGARRHVLPPPADTSLEVDLDTDNYRDPEALADYAHQLLVAAREPDVPTPYRNRDDDRAAAVAAAIAEKATARPTRKGRAESFLLAQLLARAVRGRQQVLDVTRAGWAMQLPADVGAAFDEDLARLGNREPTARALLTALAFAKGPGLPWETIWVSVARPLAAYTGNGTAQLDDDHVRWLLDKAGAYVVEDLGPGDRSVFRPFHDLLAAHLRGQPSEEQTAADPAAGDAWAQRRRQVEEVFTRALLGAAPAVPDGRPDWHLAHPYLRTYLAQHGHAAGTNTFAELVADLDYLAVADPATLTPLLTPTDPPLRRVARPYRRARPLFGDNARDNSAYLQEAVLAQTGFHPTGQRIRPTYRTLMALVRRDDSLLTLTGHAGHVRSVAFGVGGDGGGGRPLLASAGDDGTVRLWDPATGTPVGDPLRGHTGHVLAVAFTVGGGRQLLASAGLDGTVRLWDPATGTPVGDPLRGHTGRVLAVAFGVGADGGDGRPLLASAGDDGTVRLWDPATGTPVGDPLRGHTGRVLAVAFGVGADGGDGRPLLASAGDDGTVRLWDPATGTPAGDPLRGHTGQLLAVAFGVGADGGDGRPLLASAGSDGTVRLWDPSTGTPVGDPLRGHTGHVLAVAFTVGGGRQLLASAGLDGTVRLWDPATGTTVGDPMRGHTGWVLAVAFRVGADDGDGRQLLASAGSDGTVRLWEPGLDPSRSSSVERLQDGMTAVAFGVGGGRLLLASAGSDGTVRLWDPATGTPVGDPLRGHTGRVLAVAFGVGADGGGGRPLLASAGDDGTVRLWDPSTGTPVGDPLRGHTGRVPSVAFGVGADGGDGRPVLASAGSDGTVRLWDPATGMPAGDPLRGHTGQVLAVAFSVGDGRRLLASAGDDGTVRLWDPATGTPVGHPLRGHTRRVRSVAFGVGADGGDGRTLLASAASDGTVRLWDPATGTPVGDPLSGHTGSVYAVAFGVGGDGRTLMASAASDRTVRLWDPSTGATIVTLLRRTGPTAVATHGTQLAVADGEGIIVVEVMDGAG